MPAVVVVKATRAGLAITAAVADFISLTAGLGFCVAQALSRFQIAKTPGLAILVAFAALDVLTEIM